MPKSRILIIDSLSGATPLKTLLERGGYAVEIASVRADAETAVNVWKPDLTIINIFCHTISALDFIEELGATPGAQEQKILVLSRQPSAPLVCGDKPAVQGYLAKPVDFPALGALLKKHAGAALPNKRIPVLVADDDPKSSDLIRMYLETEYYRPLFASTEAGALSVLKSEKPAAVILDLLLAESDGFSLIRALRANADYAGLPVIVATGLRLNKFLEKGFLSGGPELVGSNISEEQILATVRGLLADSAKASASAAPRPKVFLADDQAILLELMKDMLEKAGFAVAAAEDGNEALESIRKYMPDIVVLDYEMPGLNGFEVASILKADSLYASVPIILLTAVADKQLKLKGLSLGLDDYLVKPVDADELVARIRMILRRTKQVLDTNPLTRLPGNPSIQARIEREIARGVPFAVLYVDLNQFKAFNDGYGFDAGDKVLKAIANILVNQTRQCDRDNGFIGHIGGDDFIVVCSFKRAEELAKRIIADLDAVVPSFYNEEDRRRGFIVSTDRQGRVQQFPFLSVSIGLVHNTIRKLTSLAQISQIGSELKHAAKQSSKSACIIDRRSS
ncbi:MAG: response regulator [Elusimicrobiales bacterium]|nr:response regulator [Elusimicrobiales bacterium]